MCCVADLVSILQQFEKAGMSLQVTDPTIEEDYKLLQTEKIEEESSLDTIKTTAIEIDLPLYDYQKVGVNFLDKVDNPMLWDEVRLGKLYQTLGYIHYKEMQGNPINKILVICPNKTKINWARKSMELINRPANIVDVRVHMRHINIINYERLSKFADKYIHVNANGKQKKEYQLTDSIARIEWDLIVIDESHKIKAGSRAIRGELVLQLTKKARKVIQLTATPMPKGPKDLVAQLKAAKALDKLFNNEWSFLRRYCGAYKTRFGWKFDKATNTEELRDILKKITLKRTQAEVWKDMPPVREDIVYLEMVNPDIYKALEMQFAGDMEQADEYFKGIYKTLAGKSKEERTHIISKFQDAGKYKSMTSIAMIRVEKLKQEIARQKIEASEDFFEELIENNTKALVGSLHIDIAKAFHEKYPQSVLIIGEIGEEEADRRRLKFQNDPNILFAFCTQQSVSEGLDFSAADMCVVTELGWVPDDIVQFTGRIKNSEKRNPLSTIFLIMNNSIEDSIIKVLLDKSITNEKIIGGVMITKILLQITALKDEGAIETL